VDDVLRIANDRPTVEAASPSTVEAATVEGAAATLERYKVAAGRPGGRPTGRS
jgi:hypothetical protein